MKYHPFDIGRMTILYIDTDDHNTEIVGKMLLSNYPMQHILLARNGFEAILKIKENLPDIFIINLHMSMIEGFFVVKEIDIQGRIDQVVVLSVSTEKKVIELCINAGVKHCFCKPIDFDDLFCNVDSLMERIFVKRIMDWRACSMKQYM